jgi:hypothetical protein
MTAAATVIPFQPVPGLPIRDALVRAHGHIEKQDRQIGILKRAYEAAGEAKEKAEATMARAKSVVATGVKKHGNTIVQASLTGSAAMVLGGINGRFGGERGVVEKWGVSLDQATFVAGHLAGFISSYMDDGEDPKYAMFTSACHTVGNAAIVSSLYRFTHQRGAESAQRARDEKSGGAMAANANGAKGGVVYTVHPKNA